MMDVREILDNVISRIDAAQSAPAALAARAPPTRQGSRKSRS